MSQLIERLSRNTTRHRFVLALDCVELVSYFIQLSPRVDQILGGRLRIVLRATQGRLKVGDLVLVFLA